MLRGRIMSANGVKADDIKAQPNASWVLQSDRGITFAAEVPRGSTVVEGDWWGAGYQGPPLISFEKKIADGLHLKIGDPIVVNVARPQYRDPHRQPAHRAVENLGINFVLVFSPSAFAGAPHTDIATLTYPGGRHRRGEISS
jgi:putative ABC transport system permease protein